MKPDLNLWGLQAAFGACLLLSCGATTAESGISEQPKPVTLSLWAGTPPGRVSDKEESDLPSRGDNVRRVTDVSHPTLTFFPAQSAALTSPAIVIFPGGGYNILAYDKEGTEVAEWANGMGFHAVLVKYRVPGNREGALMDAQRAMRLVRQHASEWKVRSNQIGVIGFSAGGHLAARVGAPGAKAAYASVDNTDKQDWRPNFEILIYPAYLADADGRIAPEVGVSKATPPTFIIQTMDDKKFIEGTIGYEKALKEAKVPSEVHLFPVGGHGYGLRPSTNAVCKWPDLCRAWLQRTSK